MKTKTETKPKKVINFYTKEELEFIVNELKLETPKKTLAKKLEGSYNRSYEGALMKIKKISKELEDRKSLTDIGRRKSRMDIRVKRELSSPVVTKEDTSIASIGIEIPHGMSFEGKPQRIMLHSDHFRIYF